MNSILNQIITHKKEELSRRKKEVKVERLRVQISGSLPPRDFKGAITQGDKINTIAEVKFASPSEGVLAEDFDPVSIASDYLKGGAVALSILTEQKFFKGELDFIPLIKKENPLPILQKDFIIDSYQIYESKVYGADAILLIVSILSKDALGDFISLSGELGMEALVEVHDEEELSVALDTGCSIIGINNRNLKTFKIDLATTIKLMSSVPPGKVVVSESGIKSREDIIRLEESGVRAVLIGEILMRTKDRISMLKELRGDIENQN